MARNENPPFGRGETFYGVNGQTPDANNLGGVHLEGHEWVFEDVNYGYAGATSFSAGAKPVRTNKHVTCRCVRNMATFNILPSRVVHMQRTAGNALQGRVDGMGTTTAEGPAFPADEWLPAAGVPQYDLFWIVVDGAATVLTDLAALDSSTANPTLIAVGDILVSLTAVTSGATTSGRVSVQGLTGATAVLGNNIQNRIGRAMSAATTANTNSRVLIDVGKW